ncbi:hypothetical protein GURASL_25470 [Geotalea uraniireducens]|uniref:Transcription factor zinc-finger domain-containing protein n=1 Tax=Geotalea uraniireducens TaxID=351604 RepID=A0ABM8EMG8_9BACT|nr:zf-TFIIB domain-containing protein [Geotalea uraniireducens]BDV43624.1 hypothetical protein GURASL_25470 [Geotalea uraniireducens]
MHCPVCKVALLMTERFGVEIDYCPQCRGIWLDRGELDKIVARVEPPPTKATAAEWPAPSGHQGHHAGHHDGGRHDNHDSRRHFEAKPHRKRSMLAQLFDFD